MDKGLTKYKKQIASLKEKLESIVSEDGKTLVKDIEDPEDIENSINTLGDSIIGHFKNLKLN